MTDEHKSKLIRFIVYLFTDLPWLIIVSFCLFFSFPFIILSILVSIFFSILHGVLFILPAVFIWSFLFMIYNAFEKPDYPTIVWSI